MTDEPNRSQGNSRSKSQGNKPLGKKTEMIEVRVSYETKHAFLDACRGAGRTASDVIREGIDEYIDQRRRPQPAIEEKASANVLALIPKPMRSKRYVAAGVAAVGLSLLTALPSAAAPDLAATFKKLDADGDGALTSAEFGKREIPGVKQMGLRIPRPTPRTDADKEADRAKPKMFVIPAPTDGKPVSELMRDVSLRGIGIPPAEESMALSFAAFDANRNGSVDMEEFLGRQRLMLTNGFAKLDKDGSGGLDASEYSAVGKSFIAYPPNAILELGNVPAKYGPVASSATLEAEFAKHDADKDGKLTLKEYLPQS